jgi:pantetheine-phosphate adenylyltransferase
MERIAVFPGSFDPITIGHVDIIERASALFDKIIIGVGSNSTKEPMFGTEKRLEWIRSTFKDNSKIVVGSYSGLTIDFCKAYGAKYILRGLRTSTDFQFEKAIAQMNQQMNSEIETIFMLSSPQFSPVSSTIVRDIIRHGGDASRFVPATVTL